MRLGSDRMKINKEGIDMPNKKKLKLRKSGIVFLILIAIFLFSSLTLVFFFKDLNHNKQLQKDLIDEVYKEVETTSPTNDGVSTETKNVFTIDFNLLKKENSDVKGWIRYNNKKINYPVVQASDNEYYLNRSFDKKSNQTGSIFLDYRNNNFNDKNTVIYGHNTDDGSMFGSMGDIFKDGYFDNLDNHYLEIMLPDNTLLTYQIFSYYVVKSEERYIQTSFTDNEDYHSFLNLIGKRSYKTFDIIATTDDKVLTLSSCHGYRGTDERKVAHFKLISTEKIENNLN